MEIKEHTYELCNCGKWVYIDGKCYWYCFTLEKTLTPNTTGSKEN